MLDQRAPATFDGAVVTASAGKGAAPASAMRDWAGRQRHAVLATSSGMRTDALAGAPHLVPVVFAGWLGDLWIPVDGKPKRGAPLARVRNLQRQPRCSLLFEHYEEQWSELAWVRLEGWGDVVELSAAAAVTLGRRLQERYRQYGTGSGATRPLASGAAETAHPGALAIRFRCQRVVGWRFDGASF